MHQVLGNITEFLTHLQHFEIFQSLVGAKGLKHRGFEVGGRHNFEEKIPSGTFGKFCHKTFLWTASRQAGAPAGYLQKGFVTKFSKSSTRNFFKRCSADNLQSTQHDEFDLIWELRRLKFCDSNLIGSRKSVNDIIMTSLKLEQSENGGDKFKKVWHSYVKTLVRQLSGTYKAPEHLKME